MASTVKAIDHQQVRPHAVCIPLPGQGHINPMLKLAKLLNNRGFHITFVNAESNHRRLLNSGGSDYLNGLPTFRFETIPDGLPPENDADKNHDVMSLFVFNPNYCLNPFRQLLKKLNDPASSAAINVPPVTCIISDVLMSFTLDASQELGIPNLLFWPCNAGAFLAFFHYRSLPQKDVMLLKDVSYLRNGNLDMVIDWIPGLEGIHLKNMPSFFQTTDSDDIMMNYPMREVEKARRGSAIIFNTFDDLEREVLEALSSVVNLPPIYTIGPIHLLLKDQIVQDSALNLIESSLWKEESECLEWLGTKEPNSVVYVNFGSTTIMKPSTLIEFAWGLANSNQTFLWIVRPDLVMGDSAMLLEEFFMETKERCLLGSWCSQEQVLSHPSIGGYLTHSGWNSVIESISYGVPMVCWPFVADNPTTSWFCCTKLGVGIEIESNAKRHEIERLLRELIDGAKGKEMKKKAMEWKKMAEEAATCRTGSSSLNFDKIINQVLLSPKD